MGTDRAEGPAPASSAPPAAPPPRRGPFPAWLVEAALLLLLLSATSGLHLLNSLRQFQFHDMSAFMDIGYRIYIGQIPYIDFFYITGPVHPYLTAFFIALAGFGKRAVQAQLCTTNAVAVLAVYLLARRRLPLRPSLLVAAVAGTTFSLPISHPWYDHTAALWLILGIAGVERLLPVRTRRAALAAGLWCGAAAALSLLSKTNVGAGGAAFFLALLLAGEHRLHAILAAVAAGLAVLLGVLVPFSTLEGYLRQSFLDNHVWGRLLKGEGGLAALADTGQGALLLLGIAIGCRAGRPLSVPSRRWAAAAAVAGAAFGLTLLVGWCGGVATEAWHGWLAAQVSLATLAGALRVWPGAHRWTRAWVLLMLAVLTGAGLAAGLGKVNPACGLLLALGGAGGLAAGVTAAGLPPEWRPRFVLFCGVAAASILSAATTSMDPRANSPLIAVELALLWGLLRDADRGSADVPSRVEGGAARMARVGLCVCTLVIGALGLVRAYDLVWFGPYSFADRERSSYAIKAPALAGWRCAPGEGEAFDLAVSYLEANAPRGESLLVLPDMQVLYGVTGRDSYRKSPYAFEYEMYPAPGRQTEEFWEHLRREPPIWVVLHSHREYWIYDLSHLLRWLRLTPFLKERYRPVLDTRQLLILRLRE
ncbi:MAG: hypothetical protein HZA54_05285 [Planctomycetes bacterium]|nr:hypothetical protein [Planctomycetota bacterium]